MLVGPIVRSAGTLVTAPHQPDGSSFSNECCSRGEREIRRRQRSCLRTARSEHHKLPRCHIRRSFTASVFLVATYDRILSAANGKKKTAEFLCCKKQHSLSAVLVCAVPDIRTNGIPFCVSGACGYRS